MTERRVPVQSSYGWEFRLRNNLRREQDKDAMPPGTIAWEEHLEAWRDYAKRYGTSQSAERLAERGGFSYAELLDHLGRHPTTWELHPQIAERIGPHGVATVGKWREGGERG